MNKKLLPLILIVLCLFSFASAEKWVDVGCEEMGEDYCETCKDGYVLANFACVDCKLYNGDNCEACSDIYVCDECADGFKVDDGACVSEDQADDEDSDNDDSNDEDQDQDQDSGDDQEDEDEDSEDEDSNKWVDVGCEEMGEDYCETCKKGYVLANFACVDCKLYNGENCTACSDIYTCTEYDGDSNEDSDDEDQDQDQDQDSGDDQEDEDEDEDSEDEDSNKWVDVGCEEMGEDYCETCKKGYVLANFACVDCKLYNGENCTACSDIYTCTEYDGDSNEDSDDEDQDSGDNQEDEDEDSEDEDSNKWVDVGCEKMGEDYCETCKKGYVLANFACVDCKLYNGENCTACSDIYTCTEYDGDSDEDQDSGDNQDGNDSEDEDEDEDSNEEVDEYGCLSYGDSSFCEKCAKGYVLSNFACVPCTLYNGDNCTACSDIYTCTEYAGDDEQDQDSGDDQEDEDQDSEDEDSNEEADKWGCLSYGEAYCEKCAKGYVLAKQACVPCTVYNGDNCLACSDIYTCTEYADDEDSENDEDQDQDQDSGDDQEDEDEDSEDEDSDKWVDVGCDEMGEDYCETCKKGYVLANYSCVDCKLYNGDNCEACSDIYTCSECADGYKVDDGACVAE